MKVSIISLFLVLVNIIKAQQLVYFDDFIDNSHNWTIDYNQNYRTELKQNVYYIVNMSDYQDVLIGQKIFYNKKQNFTIETKIKHIEGSGTYGIYIDGNKDGEGIYLTISKDKFVYIFIVKKGKIDTLLKKQIYFIKPKKKYNLLTIKRIKNKYNFYINYQKVFSSKYIDLKNAQIGFYVSAKNKIMIDYLKILAHKPKINLIATPIIQKKENLGANVNSPKTEVMPVISPDGKTLYFVRDSSLTPPNYNDNDIWYSQLTDTGWTKAKNIGKPLNNEAHNFIFAVSPDNNTVFLNGIYNAFGEPLSNGISYSNRQKGNSWSIPVPIKIKNFYNLASSQAFTITPDRKAIIMSIERKNGYGGLDLYVSLLQKDGTYSEPILLSDTINTPFDEATPFIAPDSKTLYFSSNGLPGYGSADIFVSHRIDNTYLHWSEPKNLGPYINTPDWDGYFTVDAKGEYAYLVSTNNSIGKEDIFRIKLQKEAKPLPVILIYGNVYDKKNKKPIRSQIICKDLQTNTIICKSTSTHYTAEYKAILPYGKKYLIYAKKNGYFSISTILDLRNVKKYREIKKDLYLLSIDNQPTVIMKNILFEKASAKLQKEAYADLDRLYEFLKENPNVKIIIIGHTNNIGKRQTLIKLSLARAQNVKNYLVKKGIAQKRIQIKGLGPDKPLAPNNTPEGRKLNQCVEIQILKK